MVLGQLPDCGNRVEMRISERVSSRSKRRRTHLNRGFLLQACGGFYPYHFQSRSTNCPRSHLTRGQEQVSKWTEAKPVGVVGLYLDDALAGATRSDELD
eukprot:4401971-Amphidinium_carterae.1